MGNASGATPHEYVIIGIIEINTIIRSSRLRAAVLAASEVIRGRMDRKSAAAHVVRWTQEKIDPADRERFREVVEDELLGLVVSEELMVSSSHDPECGGTGEQRLHCCSCRSQSPCRRNSA